MSILKRFIDGLKVSPYPLSYTLLYPWYAKYPSLHNHTKLDLSPIKIPSEDKETCRLLFFGDLFGLDKMPVVHSELCDIFSRADLILGNLEGPISPPDSKLVKSSWSHSVSQIFLEKFIDTLNIDPNKLVLSIANNHSQDLDDEGLKTTIEVLTEKGISTIGQITEGNTQQYHKVLHNHQISVFVMAWTHWLNKPPLYSFSRPEYFGVSDEKVPINYGEFPKADCIIGMPHWEYEYQHFPRQSTRSFAQQLETKGFNIVCGMHPHVIQPLEKINDCYCLYSTGNFLQKGGHALAGSLSSRIGVLWEVEISTKQSQKGKVMGYTIHPFIHDRQQHTLNPVYLQNNCESTSLLSKIYQVP